MNVKMADDGTCGKIACALDGHELLCRIEEVVDDGYYQQRDDGG